MPEEYFCEIIEEAFYNGSFITIMDFLSQSTDQEQHKDFLIIKIRNTIQECLGALPEKESIISNIVEFLLDLVHEVNFDFENSKVLAWSLLHLVADENCSIHNFKRVVHILNNFFFNSDVTDWITNEESLVPSLQILGLKLPIIGDYECQALIFEALCRITTEENRSFWANMWFPTEKIKSLFLNLDAKQFESDCRKILNNINRNEANPRTYSFRATSVFLGSFQLRKPFGCDFWIDFNYGSRSISFYCSELDIENEDSSTSWESIVIDSDNVIRYEVQTQGSLKIKELVLTLQQPCDALLTVDESSRSKLQSNLVVIKFWSFVDIVPHLEVIFGYRYTEIQAALPSSQNDKFKKISESAEVVKLYKQSIRKRVSDSTELVCFSDIQQSKRRRRVSESTELLGFPDLKNEGDANSDEANGPVKGRRKRNSTHRRKASDGVVKEEFDVVVSHSSDNEENEEKVTFYDAHNSVEGSKKCNRKTSDGFMAIEKFEEAVSEDGESNVSFEVDIPIEHRSNSDYIHSEGGSNDVNVEVSADGKNSNEQVDTKNNIPLLPFIQIKEPQSHNKTMQKGNSGRKRKTFNDGVKLEEFDESLSHNSNVNGRNEVTRTNSIDKTPCHPTKFKKKESVNIFGENLGDHCIENVHKPQVSGTWRKSSSTCSNTSNDEVCNSAVNQHFNEHDNWRENISTSSRQEGIENCINSEEYHDGFQGEIDSVLLKEKNSKKQDFVDGWEEFVAKESQNVQSIKIPNVIGRKVSESVSDLDDTCVISPTPLNKRDSSMSCKIAAKHPKSYKGQIEETLNQTPIPIANSTPINVKEVSNNMNLQSDKKTKTNDRHKKIRLFNIDSAPLFDVPPSEQKRLTDGGDASIIENENVSVSALNCSVSPKESPTVSVIQPDSEYDFCTSKKINEKPKIPRRKSLDSLKAAKDSVLTLENIETKSRSHSPKNLCQINNAEQSLLQYEETNNDISDNEEKDLDAESEIEERSEYNPVSINRGSKWYESAKKLKKNLRKNKSKVSKQTNSTRKPQAVRKSTSSTPTSSKRPRRAALEAMQKNKLLLAQKESEASFDCRQNKSLKDGGFSEETEEYEVYTPSVRSSVYKRKHCERNEEIKDDIFSPPPANPLKRSKPTETSTFLVDLETGNEESDEYPLNTQCPIKSTERSIPTESSTSVACTETGNEKSGENALNAPTKPVKRSIPTKGSFLSDVEATIRESDEYIFQTPPSLKRTTKKGKHKNSIFFTDTETGSSEVSWLGARKQHALFLTPRKSYSERKKEQNRSWNQNKYGKKTSGRTKNNSKMKQTTHQTNKAPDSETKSKSGLSDLDNFKLVVEKRNNYAFRNNTSDLQHASEMIQTALESDKSSKRANTEDNDINQAYPLTESNFQSEKDMSLDLNINEQPSPQVSKNRSHIGLKRLLTKSIDKRIVAQSGGSSSDIIDNESNLHIQNQDNSDISENFSLVEDNMDSTVVHGGKRRKKADASLCQSQMKRNKIRVTKQTCGLDTITSEKRTKEADTSLCLSRMKRNEIRVPNPTCELDTITSEDFFKDQKTMTSNVSLDTASKSATKAHNLSPGTQRMFFPNVPIAVDTLIGVSFQNTIDDFKPRKISNQKILEGKSWGTISKGLGTLTDESLSSLNDETGGKQLHLQRFLESLSNDSSNAPAIEKKGETDHCLPPVEEKTPAPKLNMKMSVTDVSSHDSLKQSKSEKSFVESTKYKKRSSKSFEDFKKQKKHHFVQSPSKNVFPPPNAEKEPSVQNADLDAVDPCEKNSAELSPVETFKPDFKKVPSKDNPSMNPSIFFTLTGELNTLTRKLLGTLQRCVLEFRTKTAALRESIVNTAGEMIYNESKFTEKNLKSLARNCKESRIHIQKSLKRILLVGQEYFEAERKHDRKLRNKHKKAVLKYISNVQAAQHFAEKTLEEQFVKKARAFFKIFLRKLEQI